MRSGELEIALRLTVTGNLNSSVKGNSECPGGTIAGDKATGAVGTGSDWREEDTPTVVGGAGAPVFRLTLIGPRVRFFLCLRPL